MAKVTTDSGFTAEVDIDEVRDDYEFLELLKEYDTGKIQLVPDLIDVVIGKEQHKALREHCRNEKGRVSTLAMATEFNQIMSRISETSKDVKN